MKSTEIGGASGAPAANQPYIGAAAPRPGLADLTAPAPLRSLPGWLVWKSEPGEGGKVRKVPHYANGGRRHGQQGRPDDRRQLTTFEVAKAAALRRGFDGVGLALLPDWGITALDFDGCVSEGCVHPDVLAAVDGTYAELSPSGRGVRAFVRGDLGNRKDHGDREGFGFEVFSTAGFVTLTGHVLDGADLVGLNDVIATPAPALLHLCERRFGRAEADEAGAGDAEPIGLTEAQLQEALDVLDASMRHAPWLKVGMALHHETSGEGFDLWDAWSAKGEQYPGREALQRRWDSFGRGGQRPVTAHALAQMAQARGVDIGVHRAALDEFEVLPEDPAAQPKFRFLQAAAFAAGRPPAWIVRGVLPQAELAVIYGESGSGKSFFALDLVAAVARGAPWRGKRVRQGPVAYVAAEGAGGFRNRLAAYEAHHGTSLSNLPLHVLAGAPSLVEQDDKPLAAAVNEAGGASIIVIDTLAQTTAGANENSGEDMGRVLAHCKRLHRATGALVLLIHHSGKDAARGARGWSGIRAAVDAEIEVTRQGEDRSARVSKQKDGDDGEAFAFRLHRVGLGFDDDGEAISSCVVEHREAPPAPVRQPQGKWERAVYQTANDLLQLGEATVPLAAVIDQAVRSMPHDAAAGRDRRREYVVRAAASLAEAGFLGVFDDVVHMPHAAQAPHAVHAETRQRP